MNSVLVISYPQGSSLDFWLLDSSRLGFRGVKDGVVNVNVDGGWDRKTFKIRNTCKVMEIEKINLKSDVKAKEAFKEMLESKKEYDSVKITGSPADITAEKGGLKYYFEIKFTGKEENYFGAATLTEWTAALNNPGRFLFVIAQKKGDLWEFEEYTPEEFMKHNTIPPFKTYFNISLDGSAKSKGKRRKSISLDEERLRKMIEFMEELKKE